MARDWLTALRPASFRGVPFRVEFEDAAGARRLSISPIAYAETSVIEDMGRDPRIVSLTAYVVGDQADRAALALVAALDAKGPALLALPMLPAMRARVQSWRVSRARDRAGFVGVDIEFVEEGLGSAPFGPVPGAGPIADLMAKGSAIVGEALGAAYRGLLHSRESAETRAAARAAGRLAAILPLTAGGGETAQVVEAAVAALADASSSSIAEPDAYAKALIEGWRRAAANGDAETLFAAIPIELKHRAEGVAGVAEAAALAGAMAIVAVRRTYNARQDAARARETLRIETEATLADVGTLGAEAYQWAAAITGDAARALSRTAASRAPLVRVETKLSLSSIRAAYDLYGDANRGGELVDRNKVATPAFLPLAFEALTE